MTSGNVASASRPEPATRQWGKTVQTQAQILAAAEEVFVEHGYTAATISDVIDRAGSSVGSIYHHFGGKAELFLALWTDYTHRRERDAADAVAKARREGVTEPIELFETGGTAYLRGIWRSRKVMAIFWSGDGPPGFETLRRERTQDWIAHNVKLLGLGKTVEDHFIAAVFTAIMGEAARSIIACSRAKQADAISDEALRIARIVSEYR